MDLTPKKKREISLWIVGTVTACILVFLAVQNIGTVASALSWLLGLISPLILGFALAVVLNVPMRFFEELLGRLKKPMSGPLCRALAFLISLVLILGIVIGLIWLVIPELVNAFGIIINGLLGFANMLSSMSVEELNAMPFGKLLLSVDWNGLLASLQDWLKTEGGNIVNSAFGTIGSVLGGVFDFLVTLVFTVYILLGKDTLKAQAARLTRAWLPEKTGEGLIHAAAVADVNFRNFISGQTLEAVIIGVLCMLGMLLLGMPYAPMVGALVGVTALIPVVGAFIGAGIGAFMILTVDPLKAVGFVVYLVILQQVEGNVIYPKVMGSRVNLPGIWILAAVTVGGGIAGPIGMLLSVPVASTAYVLLREATEKKEEKLGIKAIARPTSCEAEASTGTSE